MAISESGLDARGLCECGCGKATRLPKRTYSKRGWFAGIPQRFISGHNWKGKKRSESERQALSRNKTGPKNHNWKERPGYQSIHIWLRKHHPKTGICERCKRAVGTKGPGGTHYANISGDYRRDRSDYRELCSSCHKLYDIRRKRGTEASLGNF